MDDVYVKSGALGIEELPENSFKTIIDGEAINIGLKSKYEAECVRKFLWKRMMFIEPVSFALRFLLEYFTYVDIPCMVQFVVNGSVFTYVWCMDNIVYICARTMYGTICCQWVSIYMVCTVHVQYEYGTICCQWVGIYMVCMQCMDNISLHMCMYHIFR